MCGTFGAVLGMLSRSTEAVEGGTRDEVSLDVEDVANGRVDGNEALGRSGRFEALHLALSSPHWLVRRLRPPSHRDGTDHALPVARA